VSTTGNSPSKDMTERQIQPSEWPAGTSAEDPCWVRRRPSSANPRPHLQFKSRITLIPLGKDDKGWSMYIDHQRSWFLHNNVHSNRADGGIDVGSTVGILLDLERRQLTFYVNDESQVCRSVTLVLKLVSVSTKILFCCSPSGDDCFQRFVRNLLSGRFA
jgi:hypothetical protein